MYSSLALSLSYICLLLTSFLFFFFNDTATTEIYTLSLHDALPISRSCQATPREYGRGSETAHIEVRGRLQPARRRAGEPASRDRKSTRLNSSHGYISYAVFCLKKKKMNTTRLHM